MKIWVTKYALTEGIYEREVEPPDGNYFHFSGPWGGKIIHKKYCHKTHEGAIEHAKKMRRKKIWSLKKNIIKLEDMRFDA